MALAPTESPRLLSGHPFYRYSRWLGWLEHFGQANFSQAYISIPLPGEAVSAGLNRIAHPAWPKNHPRQSRANVLG